MCLQSPPVVSSCVAAQSPLRFGSSATGQWAELKDLYAIPIVATTNYTYPQRNTPEQKEIRKKEKIRESACASLGRERETSVESNAKRCKNLEYLVNNDFCMKSANVTVMRWPPKAFERLLPPAPDPPPGFEWLNSRFDIDV